MNKNTGIIVAVVLIILAGVGGFFAGKQYQTMQRGTRGQFGANGQFVRRFGQNGTAAVGQIISQDSNSITVKMQDGSTKIILLSSQTVINKQATGSASDLKQGETVAAFGTTNSDGSITAQNIQLNPQMRMRMGRPTQTQ